jgi:hypothetical protein
MSCATCGPVSAQWGDRGGLGDQRSGGWGWDNRPSGGWGGSADRAYRSSPYRDFFSPFSGDRHNRSAPAVDYSKAPSPRKLEKPVNNTVVVIGDSMADWLGYGLDEKYSDQPQISFERKIRASSGLVRYDPKNEALDWPQVANQALSNEKPDAIVVMLGLNDRAPLRDKALTEPKRTDEPSQESNQPVGQGSKDKKATQTDRETLPQTAGQTEPHRQVSGASYDFRTDQWATIYAKRIDAMIAALKSKGVPVVWVGLPAIRGTKSSGDMKFLDDLYRERAERAGILYVDIWDGFVDEDGDYAAQGPDFEGQIRRLRTADGVHFTKAGALKIASYVERELRRVILSSVAPVTLPGPDTNPKSALAGARPDVGPVLPLTGSAGDHGGDLLGAGAHPNQTTSDPIALKVLGRGEALAPAVGRADDFTWPRHEDDVSAKREVSSEPVAAVLDMPEKQNPIAKADGRIQAEGKKDAKKNSHISSRVGARRYYNYYPGRYYGWQQR